MALTGSDPVGLVGWVRDLTYAEVHAATFGAMHATGIFLSIVLAFAGVPYAAEAGVTLAIATFALMGWLPQRDAADVPGVSHVLARIPPALKGQIRKESHYYGGFGIGTFVVEVTAYVAYLAGWLPF